jgi:hypothetical protein
MALMAKFTSVPRGLKRFPRRVFPQRQYTNAPVENEPIQVPARMRQMVLVGQASACLLLVLSSGMECDSYTQ